MGQSWKILKCIHSSWCISHYVFIHRHCGHDDDSVTGSGLDETVINAESVLVAQLHKHWVGNTTIEFCEYINNVWYNCQLDACSTKVFTFITVKGQCHPQLYRHWLSIPLYEHIGDFISNTKSTELLTAFTSLIHEVWDGRQHNSGWHTGMLLGKKQTKAICQISAFWWVFFMQQNEHPTSYEPSYHNRTNRPTAKCHVCGKFVVLLSHYS